MEGTEAILRQELLKVKAKAYDFRDNLDKHVKLLSALCDLAGVEDTNALSEFITHHKNKSDSRITKNG